MQAITFTNKHVHAHVQVHKHIHPLGVLRHRMHVGDASPHTRSITHSHIQAERCNRKSERNVRKRGHCHH
jgi:hypothetical protein